MPKIQTQAELISTCHTAIKSSNPFASIEAIMQNLFTIPSDVLENIIWTKDNQAISSIYISSEISIRKIVIPPYYHGHIHDHNIWTIGGVIQGEEENVYYQESMHGLSECHIEKNKAHTCFSMQQDVIHAVRNNSAHTTISLHIYGGNLMQEQKYIWHPLTLEKLPYNYDKAHEFSQLMTANLSSSGTAAS